METTLNKAQRRSLDQYLSNARATHIAVTEWNVLWTDCHGETRSSSKVTFHIAIRLTSTGEHWSCIHVGSKPHQFIASGTKVQWASRPSLSHILNEYKRMYNIDPTTSSSSSPSDDENDKKNEKGKGKWKGKGKGQEKK